MGSDVTQFIERLEAFEEREGVRLEALFAHIDSDGYLTVNGEVHPRDGARIWHDIVMHIEVHDHSERAVAQGDVYFPAKQFFGFGVFQLSADLPVRDLLKIRVYPEGTQLEEYCTSPNSIGWEFVAPVVGIKYHRRNTDGLNIGDLVQLVREPENIHDPNAVQVKVLGAELLGYVPGQLAPKLAELLDAGTRVQARISSFSFSRTKAYLALVVGKGESNSH